MRNHLPSDIDVERTLPYEQDMPREGDEEGLDRIIRLTAQFFDVRGAYFTVIEGSAGAIRARWAPGLHPDADAFPVDALAFLQQDLALAPDLRSDPRFATHPTVTGEPWLRFHAAAAVRVADGASVGILSLVDLQPRRFTPDDSARLADFAHLVGNELMAVRSKQILSRQRDSERRIRELMDCLPEGVLMLDGSGTIVSCNAVAERMYRATEEGLVGLAASELTADDPERLGALLEAGVVDQIQAVARRVDGSEFPVEFSVKILDATSVRRYALIVRDISLRKEEERMASIADARRRSYFVTATHELRTPMASVLGFSELLLKRDFDAAEGRQLIEIVHRQAQRLVNLINEMLDLARIESGGRDALDMRVQDASTMLAATLSGLSGLGADHRIRSRPVSDLPLVKADASKLQQALTNIISNAVKYSDNGSEIHIDVFATSLDGKPAVGFRVADQGIGMTRDEQARIYEPFFRADEKAEASGTGLGMTIFKEIIDLHGGAVEIQSSRGRGTTVTFLLPSMSAVD